MLYPVISCKHVFWGNFVSRMYCVWRWWETSSLFWLVHEWWRQTAYRNHLFNEPSFKCDALYWRSISLKWTYDDQPHRPVLKAYLYSLVPAFLLWCWRTHTQWTLFPVTLPSKASRAPGAFATVTMTGMDLKQLTAGTVKYQVYESFVPSFHRPGLCELLHLHQQGIWSFCTQSFGLKFPEQSSHSLCPDFYFRYASTNQVWGLSLYFHGVDQDHQPYDFDGTISYKISM